MNVIRTENTRDDVSLHDSKDQKITGSFNGSQRITANDIQLTREYRSDLLKDFTYFKYIFRDYLSTFPPASTIAPDNQGHADPFSSKEEKQLQYFAALLDADITEKSATRLLALGKDYYHTGYTPEWIMGVYRLFQSHLQSSIINSCEKIAKKQKEQLTEALVKLLFRDMGLVLKGYWDASLRALKEEENKNQEVQDHISSIMANIPQLLWSTDVVNHRLLYVSPAMRKTCDTKAETIIPCLEGTIPEDKKSIKLAWKRALRGNRAEVESRSFDPGGELRWFRRIFNPLLDDAGNVVRIDGLMEDISESRKNVDHLQYLATTDILTGLANRALWFDRLSQALLAAKRKEKQRFALMILDLNNFKIINDTFGHATGDEILAETGQRLQAALRESDTLARLGGDEFAILLPDITNDMREIAEKIAKNIMICFHKSFACESHDININASIGIALFPDHGRDVKTLMSRADASMYRAKAKGGGFHVYCCDSDSNTTRHLKIASDLRHALNRKQLTLRYQPKIDIKTGKIHSAEALLRWRHPVHGLVNPTDFIPVAERTGIINEITRWVIKNVCSQQNEWRKSGLDIPVTVNISSRTFHDPRMVNDIIDILQTFRAPPLTLEIDITENTLMSDVLNRNYHLEKLNEMGIMISIDDFGLGSSSLSHLKRMPIGSLKIDKSFISGMQNDENDAAIVRSTIDLGHDLGIKVVAEGVENSHAFQTLEQLGCDYAQGFYISHPLSADELLRWVQH
ncbi:MAG: EAL domain-containing protein [Gammaproteobacteria bacterium]|nr:EAL domain-containing protein [Gammaproteobacteria bacterium]